MNPQLLRRMQFSEFLPAVCGRKLQGTALFSDGSNRRYVEVRCGVPPALFPLPSLCFARFLSGGLNSFSTLAPRLSRFWYCFSGPVSLTRSREFGNVRQNTGLAPPSAAHDPWPLESGQNFHFCFSQFFTMISPHTFVSIL